MSSPTPKWTPAFLPDPLGFLEDLQDLLPWREVIDRHYFYGVMDQSATTGNVRIRPSFDNSWGCFDYCRPHKEEAEATRILQAFDDRLMFLQVVGDVERDAVQRLSNAPGYKHKYVSIPVGFYLAVLSTGPLGNESIAVFDQEHMVRDVVMKVRWFGSLSSSRGFLPSARQANAWEAYHRDTGRRCLHNHGKRNAALECAINLGIELDGSSDGWYVRSTSEWMKVGIVRVKTLRELAASAEKCGLDVALYLGAVADDGGRLSIGAVEWDDLRFVRFRKQNHWKAPLTATGEWQPPDLPQAWSIDTRGRVTGS